MDDSRGYLLTGENEAAVLRGEKLAADFLGIKREELGSHPDFLRIKTSFFSIEEARGIRGHSGKSSFSGKGRAFMVQTDFFGLDAQNALLKTFEEPGGRCCFVLVTSAVENVIPTLRSRLTGVKLAPGKTSEGEKEEQARDFLSASVTKRLEMIKDIAEEKEKSARFINSLQSFLRKEMLSDISKPRIADALSQTENCKKLLLTPGAMVKMILEHLAFVLPQI